jgi:hypothetical protein
MGESMICYSAQTLWNSEASSAQSLEEYHSEFVDLLTRRTTGSPQRHNICYPTPQQGHY